MSQHTYHVLLGKRRSTVSVDSILSTLIALKLGNDPETEEAHSAVRNYLQETLDNTNDPGRIRVSQWLREQILLELVDKKLSGMYWKWFDKKHLGGVLARMRG